MTELQEQPVKQPEQICSIRIGFPVTTDEHAIRCKQRIVKFLADIPQVRIEFSLSSMPPRG